MASQGHAIRVMMIVMQPSEQRKVSSASSYCTITLSPSYRMKCLTDEKVDDSTLHGWVNGGHLRTWSVLDHNKCVEVMRTYIFGERAAVGGSGSASSDCVSSRAVWRVNEDTILTSWDSAARWGVARTADLSVSGVALLVWATVVWHVAAIDWVAVTAIAWHITAIARVLVGTAAWVSWSACWCSAGGSAGRVWVSNGGGGR